MNQASPELPLHSRTPRNKRGVCFVLGGLSQPLTRNCGASNVEFFQPGFCAPQMLRSASSECSANFSSPVHNLCFWFIEVFIVQLISSALSGFGVVHFFAVQSLFRKPSEQSCSLVVASSKVRCTIRVCWRWYLFSVIVLVSRQVA